jgi:MFS family permease
MTLAGASLTTRATHWPAVAAIALSQLVAWGVLYYAFAVIAEPMGAETGWSRAQMNGALSLGLCVGGCAAYWVGRRIDRHGGRGVMTLGAIFGAVAVMAWSYVTSLWQLYAVFVLIGIASSMTLYEAAFAVTARLLPGQYRRAITAITLVGGLASTVSIPLTHMLVEAFGWRQALQILALILVSLCAVIAWNALRPVAQSQPLGASVMQDRRALWSRVRSEPVFWLLLTSFISYAFFYTSLLFTLLPLMQNKGFTPAGAIALYTLIGPSQVGGRLVLFALDRIIPTTIMGAVATVLPVVAMAVLMTASPGSAIVMVFPILFGTGMGIKTVVQATAAPEFLGVREYGALQGLIALPVSLAQALSPFAAALLWPGLGPSGNLERVLMFAAILSAAGFIAAAILARRR